jgi:small nuclear ribonucleoprotein (snRNP)-like protein
MTARLYETSTNKKVQGMMQSLDLHANVLSSKVSENGSNVQEDSSRKHRAGYNGAAGNYGWPAM